MKQLVTRVCSRERLNPRHHSLQYIDFKHEFLDMASTVDEIEVSQIRLMDKRGNMDFWFHGHPLLCVSVRHQVILRANFRKPKVILIFKH